MYTLVTVLCGLGLFGCGVWVGRIQAGQTIANAVMDRIRDGYDKPGNDDGRAARPMTWARWLS